MQGVTVLPLHGGHAPKWLFPRMVKLSGLVAEAIIDEYGTGELLKRLADPYWFQAFSCAIGYDWHSSGTTTVTVGALKEALNHKSDIFIAGGKGKQGTDTPNQIVTGADYLSIPQITEDYKRYSRMTAKIDSALIYDNIGIYHHAFIFSKNKEWTVVQQAMDDATNSAIRFQISSEQINKENITNETNSAISAQLHKMTTDLTYTKNVEIKENSLRLVKEDLSAIHKVSQGTYFLPKRHEIAQKIDLSKRALTLLDYVNDIQPESYEEMMLVKGMGRKTLRSLAMVSSLIYDSNIYQRDPIFYSYNLGGKDGIPFPVDRQTYDKVVGTLRETIDGIKLDNYEKQHMLKRLNGKLNELYNQQKLSPNDVKTNTNSGI